jgi:hypothetical protein
MSYPSPILVQNHKFIIILYIVLVKNILFPILLRNISGEVPEREMSSIIEHLGSILKIILNMTRYCQINMLIIILKQYWRFIK